MEDRQEEVRKRAERGKVIRDLLSKATYRRIKKGEGEYRVLIPSSGITGIVSKSWARLGGWGWTYDGKPYSWETRKDATRAMIMARMDKGIN